MSQWHRHNPELVGTDSDPWMRHADYRRFVPMPESERDALRDEARGSEDDPGFRSVVRSDEEKATWDDTDEDRTAF